MRNIKTKVQKQVPAAFWSFDSHLDWHRDRGEETEGSRDHFNLPLTAAKNIYAWIMHERKDMYLLYCVPSTLGNKTIITDSLLPSWFPASNLLLLLLEKVVIKWQRALSFVCLMDAAAQLACLFILTKWLSLWIWFFLQSCSSSVWLYSSFLSVLSSPFPFYT